VLVWDRQAGLHARDRRPTEEFAGFCGQLKVDWCFCGPADPQAKGAVERLQGFVETNFEPGRVFCNELDFQNSARRMVRSCQPRTHKTLRERPIDRLARELELMAPLPEQHPMSTGAG
jgi:transposase